MQQHYLHNQYYHSTQLAQNQLNLRITPVFSQNKYTPSSEPSTTHNCLYCKSLKERYPIHALFWIESNQIHFAALPSSESKYKCCNKQQFKKSSNNKDITILHCIFVEANPFFSKFIKVKLMTHGPKRQLASFISWNMMRKLFRKTQR